MRGIPASVGVFEGFQLPFRRGRRKGPMLFPQFKSPREKGWGQQKRGLAKGEEFFGAIRYKAGSTGNGTKKRKKAIFGRGQKSRTELPKKGRNSGMGGGSSH